MFCKEGLRAEIWRSPSQTLLFGTGKKHADLRCQNPVQNTISCRRILVVLMIADIHPPCSMGQHGLFADFRCSGHQVPVWAESASWATSLELPFCPHSSHLCVARRMTASDPFGNPKPRLKRGDCGDLWRLPTRKPSTPSKYARTPVPVDPRKTNK